ncbi:HlyD family type I secretion periplasmic adaptor subunit [Arenibaculum pallidiluteum]|uniref:HlyD family type I secretion periplasmic adaptor subunit n=1 Tax=Arenibaculum pallidiluteum TaxID=2812559 RepID=UPI001A962C88|nr:HlyD family type I secretion periplasmic adaptor subunit [Arenibaculum pallidiluteum]
MSSLTTGAPATALPAPRTAAAFPELPATASQSVRGLRRVGWLTIAIFFGGFGGWAWQAPLTSAAVASGVVAPDGKRRTVQHLEGGIVDEILVREGTQVAAGQPVLRLADVRARSQNESLEQQVRILSAIEARLVAEQKNLPAPAFPAELTASSDPRVVEVVTLQSELFETRRAARRSQEVVLDQRILQLREEIAGHQARIRSQDAQLALIVEEAKGVRELVDKGLERRPRLLALERAKADIEGDRATSRAEIARAEQAIGEARAQILAETERWQNQVGADLADTRTKLATTRSEIQATRDALERTLVRSPVAGQVMEMRITTSGGVIRAGDPIMDVVPADAELVIDAQVSPMDIDDVHVGLEAHVVLSAFKQRNLPRLTGTVRDVTADRLTDQRTGQPYFLARVVVPREEMARLAPGLAMTPGMPAEVMIATGERTMLDYLVQPFLDSLRRSFRES